MLNLMDDFEFKGQNETDLLNTLNELSDSTKIINLDLNQLTFLSYISDDSEKIAFNMYEPYCLEKAKEYSIKKCINVLSDFLDVEDIKKIVCEIDLNNTAIKKYLKKKQMKENGITQEIIDELCNETKLMLIYKNKLFFTSKKFVNSLLQFFKISGDFFVNHSDERSRLAAKLCESDKYKNLKCVYKEIGKIRKMYCVVSDRYELISQSESYKIISNLFSKKNNLTFSITNFKTMISYEISSNNGIQTGIEITNSDTKDTSLTIRGIYKFNNMSDYLYANEININHIGIKDTNVIVEKVHTLIEELKDISNLTKVFLDKENYILNLKEIINKSDIKLYLGKKRTTQFIKENEYNPNWYKEILNIPDKYNDIGYVQKNKLKEVCGRLILFMEEKNE